MPASIAREETVEHRLNHMKRVALLVLLIVSLVELDWERARIYLFSSLASLVLVVWSELVRRRRGDRTIAAGALSTDESVSRALDRRYRE